LRRAGDGPKKPFLPTGVKCRKDVVEEQDGGVAAFGGLQPVLGEP
jgi:hypothetical protein